MISKIIFVLASLCVVNASVLTVNAFDDDPRTELASNPKDCNFQACDQLCRRLKFPGGACVNGRCKCDKLRIAEDEVSEKSLSNVEDPVSEQDDPEAEVAASPSRCNLKACDLVCQWLKKRRGSCVDGRCKCVKSQEGNMTRPEKFLSPSSCNFRACDQQCFRFGYSGGTCVNGRCKCNRFLNAEDTLTDSAEPLPLSSCNSIACDNKCRRSGWHSGVCVKGQCKCDYFLYTEDAVAENALSNLEDNASDNFFETEDTLTDSAEPLPLSSCNSIACDDKCRRNGWHSGVCVKGQCKCDHFLYTEDAVAENALSNLEDNESDNFFETEDASDSQFPIRICRLSKCRRKCNRRGYELAKCVDGRCKCYKKTHTKDTMNDLEESVSLEDNFLGTKDAVDEYSEFAQRRICRLPKCNRTCTRRGYEVAKCIYGRCKCFNKTQAQDEISETSLSVSEMSEDQTERGCIKWVCDILCRRLKFPSGACVNDRCQCNKFFRTEEEPSPRNDVTRDQNEESNVILRTYKDASDSQFPIRICRLSKCRRKCNRRGYELAKCVDGRCKCYKKTKDASPLNDVTSDENEESNFILGTNEEESTVSSPRACNSATCNQICHRLNHVGGWCRFGQCQCY